MSKKLNNEIGYLQSHLYDVIKSPIVTEKTTLNTQHGSYSFYVDKSADKGLIKIAVQKLFNVEVLSVNTLNRPGKQKRFKGRLGQRQDQKKAIVRVAEGQTIDVTVKV